MTLSNKPIYANDGRPRIVTKERLLDTIREYGTTKPSELAKILCVSRATIYNYLKEISKDEMDVALKEAKPSEGIEQLTLGSSIKVWLPKGDREAAKKAIRLIELYSGIDKEK